MDKQYFPCPKCICLPVCRNKLKGVKIYTDNYIIRILDCQNFTKYIDYLWTDHVSVSTYRTISNTIYKFLKVEDDF